MPNLTSNDGTRIHYEVAGEGTPLLLCNASFATLQHWQPAVASLAHGCRVATWDYRGHGDSEAPGESDRYSLAQVVEDLRGVHQAIAGDRPACIGGLSIGGLVSLSYALRFPGRVRALLLFNTGPGFKNPEAAAAWNDMLRRTAARMEAVGLERYLEGKRARAELLGRNPDSDAAREARQAMLRSSVSGLTRFALQVAGPVPNLVDRLHENPPPPV